MKRFPISRTPHIIAMVCGMTAMTLSAALAHAFSSTDGTFDLSWSTIDGGGGTSTGGVFEVAGTIGQPDAGVILAGGTYEVRGGFWASSVEPIDTCPADIAPPPGDGTVGVPDLLAIINAWGACPILPTPCPADIAPPVGDNVVGVPDLLAVINAWGICP